MARVLSQQEIENKTVVQCPSCRAKFAINRELLAQHDEPRFHCSRCDHVFPAEPANFIEPLRAVEKPTEESSPEVKTTTATEFFNNNDQFVRPSLDFTAPMLASEKPKPAVSLSVPTKVEKVVAPPHESSEVASQTSFSFTANRKPKPQPTVAQPSDASDFGDMRILNPSAINAGANSAERTFVKASISGLRGLAYVGGPILGCLAILGIVSLYIGTDVQSSGKVIAALFPEAAQVPPAGLHIEQTDFRKISLDDGESVHIISGTIANDTEQRFEDLQIEGQLFDSGGAVVARALVNAASDLSKTRLKSLTPEMILSMQSPKAKSHFDLAAGETQPFTIAVVEGEPQRAAYYSARIFSVKGRAS